MPLSMHAAPMPATTSAAQDDEDMASQVLDNMQAVVAGRPRPHSFPLYAGVVPCPQCDGSPVIHRHTPNVARFFKLEPSLEDCVLKRLGVYSFAQVDAFDTPDSNGRCVTGGGEAVVVHAQRGWHRPPRVFGTAHRVCLLCITIHYCSGSSPPCPSTSNTHASRWATRAVWRPSPKSAQTYARLTPPDACTPWHTG